MTVGSRTKKVRLVASDRMDEGSSKENEYIRVPKRARQYFASKGEKLVLRTKKNTKVLYIRKAFKCDAQALSRRVGAGKVSEEERQTTGFVTTSTWRHLYGQANNPSHCYLTDGIEDIMLGADPEFALVNPSTKKFQYAQHVPGLSLHCELGHDGPLAEVRPPPATTVDGVVDNIRKIFNRDQNKVGAYDWFGGAAYQNPNAPTNERIVYIGGHLQFGNPILLPMSHANLIYKRTVRALDEVIGLPLVKIDCPLPSLRRNKKYQGYGPYGRHGDFKAKENRFEWRVLSGLWLAHPDLTYPVMGASKAVVEACYQMMSDEKFAPEWINSPVGKKGFLKKWGALKSATVAKVINEANPEAATIDLINRSAKKLRSLENYSKYKTEIEAFIKLIKLSDKDKKRINLNLKDSWLNKGKLIKGVRK